MLCVVGDVQRTAVDPLGSQSRREESARLCCLHFQVSLCVLPLVHQTAGLTTRAAVLLTRALERCLLLVTSRLFACVEKMRRPMRAGTLDSQMTVQ